MQLRSVGRTSLRITRVYKASRGRVWRALTDPKEIAKWYAPRTMTATVLRFGARTGGSFEVDMAEASRVPHRVEGKFIEVLPGHRLVQTWRWQDFPIDTGESLLTIQLRDVPGGTELILTHEKLTNAESVKAHTGGWTDCLEKLEKIL